MFYIDEFQSLTSTLGFRPLMFNAPYIQELLGDSRFDCLGLYVVSVKTRNVNQPLTTFRYILFDRDKKPYNLDGRPIRTINSEYLKKSGLNVSSDFKNTSFLLDKEELEIILDKLLAPVQDGCKNARTPNMVPPDGASQYVIFALENYPTYQLRYEIIKGWLDTGSGPGGKSPRTPAY